MKLSNIAKITLSAMTFGAVLVAAGSAAGASAPAYPPLTATVFGHIYLDANGNGVQDSGEPNLAGVNVVVTDSSPSTRTVTTDANGNWTAVVAPGTTTANVVEATLPTGVRQTQGTDPTTVIAVAGTIADGGIDGYAPSATVSGHIYLDSNGNGTQDPGEPSLPGIALTITDSFGSTQRVVTDVNGDWTAAVPPGSTTAAIDTTTLPTGVTRTEGSEITTVIARAGVDTFVSNVGYTRNEGTIPKTGSDSPLGGSGIALGFMALGAGLLAVTKVRRRQLSPA